MEALGDPTVALCVGTYGDPRWVFLMSEETSWWKRRPENPCVALVEANHAGRYRARVFEGGKLIQKRGYPRF